MSGTSIIDIAAGKAWFDGVPPKKAQEWVSLAYLEGIIAQAGLNILNCKWDDGIDLMVGATKQLAREIPRNFFLSLQVKSTKLWKRHNGFIVYALDQDAYEKLREPSEMQQLLVLYTLPKKRSLWITPDQNSNRFSHFAYWYDLSRLTSTKNTKSTTIQIPEHNCLSSSTLIDIMKEAAKAKGWLNGN